MTDYYPINPKDAEKFKTESGLSIFNKEDNTWKNIGVVDLKLASENIDGLIYPELYEKLKLLKDVINDGLYNFSLTNNKPYFYLFNNSDSLLKFIFSNNELWIEINKSYLNQKIISRSFVGGSKGREGLVGQAGKSGVPAPNERFLTNINGIVDINLFIDNDGPISIRGYNNRKVKFFEVLLNLDGTYTDNEYFEYIKLNGNNLKLKLKDSSYLLKIRQRGPKGFNGFDGVNYVEINSYNNSIDIVKDVITNFYISGNNFVFNRYILDSFNCVFGVSADGGISNGDYFIGVELTTDECKFIEIVNPEVVLDKLSLDLPAWTPVPGCYDQSRFRFANFDWYKQFDLPFDILPNPEPKLTSCAVPFWFCGNSGNLPCDDQIDINIPIMNNDNSSSSSSSSSSESLQSEQSNSSESLSSNSSDSNSSNSSESNSSNSNSSQSISTLSSNSSQSLSSQSLSTDSSLSSGPHCCDQDSLYSGKSLTAYMTVTDYSADGGGPLYTWTEKIYVFTGSHVSGSTFTGTATIYTYTYTEGCCDGWSEGWTNCSNRPFNDPEPEIETVSGVFEIVCTESGTVIYTPDSNGLFDDALISEVIDGDGVANCGYDYDCIDAGIDAHTINCSDYWNSECMSGGGGKSICQTNYYPYTNCEDFYTISSVVSKNIYISYFIT